MIVHVQRLLPSPFRMIQRCIQPLMIRSDVSTNCIVYRMHETLRLCAFGRSGLLPVVGVQLVRCYRVRKDKELTREEEFICKIAKVNPNDASALKEFLQRLQYLVDKGCKRYELVEYPDILHLTETDIDQRIERLKSCGRSSFSMALIKLAKPGNHDAAALKRSIKKYLKDQRGRLNQVEEIQNALQCTDEEMLDVLTRNPRLIGQKKRKFTVEKVACLLRCGAVIEDIRSYTNLLNNKTLADIESRSKRLVELGCNDPLPISVIGRSDADFEVIVERLAKQRSLRPASRYLESREIIAKIPECAHRKLHVVKPKVDFLLSKGYTGAEIIEFPAILTLSLKTIRDAAIHLEAYHLGNVDIETCRKYAMKKSVAPRQSSSRRIFAKVLRCRSTELPPFPKDLRVALDTKSALQASYAFLQGVGFATAELKELPIVLAHSTDVLRMHWDRIQAEESFARHFEAWKEDKTKLMQLLEFSIERESNFSYADDGAKQRREENLETADYDEACELTELEEESYKSFGSGEEVDPVEELDAEAVDTERYGCTERNADAERVTGLDADAFDPRGERDGGTGESGQTAGSVSDASSSSDEEEEEEESSVGIENDMVKLFPSSSAR